MPDVQTPGEVAYTAYWRHRIGTLPVEPFAWEVLLPDEQAHWEAAAQAVLRQAQGTLTLDLDPDILRQEQRHA